MHTTPSNLPPWGSRTFIMGIINVTPDSFQVMGCCKATTPSRPRLPRLAAF